MPKSFNLGEAIINGIVFNIFDRIAQLKELWNSEVIMGLLNPDPPLCNLPIVPSTLGRPLSPLARNLGLLLTPFCYFHPVSALSSLGQVVGGQRKRKAMEVAHLCGVIGPPGGEEVSSCQFGPLRAPRPHPLLLLLALLLVPD